MFVGCVNLFLHACALYIDSFLFLTPCLSAMPCHACPALPCFALPLGRGLLCFLQNHNRQQQYSVLHILIIAWQGMALHQFHSCTEHVVLFALHVHRQINKETEPSPGNPGMMDRGMYSVLIRKRNYKSCFFYTLISYRHLINYLVAVMISYVTGVCVWVWVYSVHGCKGGWTGPTLNYRRA